MGRKSSVTAPAGAETCFLPRATGFVLAAAFAACASPTADDGAAPLPAQVTLRGDGWLRGDLHIHTQHSDGADTTSIVLALATFLEDERFLAVHPEYEGSGLDFIAVTDHRTVAVIDDPEFTSDRLVLVPGMEFGTKGHANIWGLSEFVDHDPDGDGVSADDIRAAIEAAHAQGALFSINHPMLPSIPWPWDTRNVEGVEVWNSFWAAAKPPITPARLASWESSFGDASPFFERATEATGILGNDQALAFYEALLSRGVHLAVIGGSDRHQLVFPAFPTTYVRAESTDLTGLLAGIRARHTYVSRTPAGPQLRADIEVRGRTYALGDRVPVRAAGEAVTVRVHVSRAKGGRLRLIRGAFVDTDDALAAAALGHIAQEASLAEDALELSWTLDVKPGDWLYPVVHEPLVPAGTPPALADKLVELATVTATCGESPAELAGVVLENFELEGFLEPTECDPARWRPDQPQCAPVDQIGFGTMFLPDPIDRPFHVVVEDGAPTDWCMGAVASAVLFTADDG